MTNAYPRFHFPPLRQRTTTTLEGPQPISEQDRETIFGQAKAEGFQQGFTEGRAEGLEQGLKEGRAQGITEGQAQGLAESQELFTRASAPLDAAVAQLNALYANAEQQQTRATLALVSRIAGLVIQQEISSRPQLLLSMIEDKLASEQLTSAQFSVQVSDADFAAITALAPEKKQQWQLQSVASLARGECIIDTAEQQIDLGCQQRLETCLTTLEQRLHVGEDAQ